MIIETRTREVVPLGGRGGRAAMVIALLVGAAAPAHAGYCLSEDEREQLTAALDRAAAGEAVRSSGADPASWLACVVQGSVERPSDPRREERQLARALAACTAVAAHDARGTAELGPACVDLLLSHRVLRAGRRDLVAVVMARPSGPVDHTSYELLAKSGDPRVHAFVVERLRAALARARSQRYAGWRRQAFRAHRLDALRALMRLADATDRAFLDEVIAATPATDAEVLALARRARAAAAAP